MIRTHDGERYRQYGKDMTKYNTWKVHCLSILLSITSDQVSSLRLALCKRFLEHVFKVPHLYLDGCLEPLVDGVEYVDLYRCMLLCSLPIDPDSPPFDWSNVEDDSEIELWSRHPRDAMARRAEAKRSNQMHFPEPRSISLRDHSWVGTLFGLLIDKPDSYIWTTDLNGFRFQQYKQFRLDLHGISPSTLLLFCSMGTVECPVHDDEEQFCFLCPKMSANIPGFNQRFITDLCRLWNPQMDSQQPGMMQLLYRNKMSVSWGNVPYVLYPYIEHVVTPKAAPANSSSTVATENATGDSTVPIKTDPESNLCSPDRFCISSTIRLGGKKENALFVGNRTIEAFDVDFGSIKIAYNSVFDLDLECVYRFESRVQNQPKILLALGCLIHDVNTLCNGFRNPDRVLPGVFRYLQKRISEMVTEGTELPSFALLSMGRSIQETFLRIRLMFRWLLGETVFGIVDGICRLTALSYCWLGLQPEQSLIPGLNASSRIIAGDPNYQMMTSPSPVSLIMCGRRYATLGSGVAISKETMNFVETYSAETQNSFENAQGISIQSALLTILRQYQEGLPFDDVQYRKVLKSVPSEHVVFTEEELFSVIPINEMSSEAQDKWYGNRIRHFLFHTIGISQQTDLITGWRITAGSVRDITQRIEFVFKVDLMKMQGARPLIDVMLRFLLLVGVRREKGDPTLPHQYAKDFLELLTLLVENNGKSWQGDGDSVRNGQNVIQNPLCTSDIVEQNRMEKLSHLIELDDDLADPTKLDLMFLKDHNTHSELMVSSWRVYLQVLLSNGRRHATNPSSS